MKICKKAILKLLAIAEILAITQTSVEIIFNTSNTSTPSTSTPVFHRLANLTTINPLNPDNDSKNIEISGSGREGILNPTFLIPEDKKGQGEFNFTLTNIGTELGGQGSASLDNFLDVTIGTGGGGQLFDTVNYRQQSFDLLAAPGPNVDFLPNVYSVSSVEGLTLL